MATPTRIYHVNLEGIAYLVRASHPSAAGVPQRQRMPAKYRCPQTGSTWSGRGLKPTWLRVALDGGKQLADFEVAATA